MMFLFCGTGNLEESNAFSRCYDEHMAISTEFQSGFNIEPCIICVHDLFRPWVRSSHSLDDIPDIVCEAAMHGQSDDDTAAPGAHEAQDIVVRQDGDESAVRIDGDGEMLLARAGGNRAHASVEMHLEREGDSTLQWVMMNYMRFCVRGPHGVEEALPGRGQAQARRRRQVAGDDVEQVVREVEKRQGWHCSVVDWQ